MGILDKDFIDMYPKIIESLWIEVSNGKINVFSIPTQHFTVDNFDELTEESFLTRINNIKMEWEDKCLNEEQLNRLRFIRLQKIFE